MAIPRTSWTGIATNGTLDGPKKAVFIHHSVSPNRLWTKRQEREHLRGIRRSHLDRGFADIGYHFAIFPSSRLYALRGINLIPAAQEGNNTGTIAIVVVGSNPRLNLLQKRRLIRAVKAIRQNHRQVKVLGGHRDVTPTECPGDNVYGWLPRLRARTGLRAP